MKCDLNNECWTSDFWDGIDSEKQLGEIGRKVFVLGFEEEEKKERKRKRAELEEFV
jgi:hypothetical protein